MNEIETIPPLDPEGAFVCTCPIYYGEKWKRTHKLPSYKATKHFSTCSAYWNEKALYFAFSIKKPIEYCTLSSIDTGDGLEILIDTRGVHATAQFDISTHHFAFIPEETANTMGGEIVGEHTKNRPPPPTMAKADIQATSKDYTLYIAIPPDALYGAKWEVDTIWRFMYIIHRYKDTPELFGVSQDMRWRHNAQTWGYLRLMKKK